MKLICGIYKSPKKDEMYLYVDKKNGLVDVPEQLLSSFGEPIEVMTMLLTADKKLGRADAGKVLAAIAEQGFYLQMPPARDSYMLNLHNNAPTQPKY